MPDHDPYRAILTLTSQLEAARAAQRYAETLLAEKERRLEQARTEIARLGGRTAPAGPLGAQLDATRRLVSALRDLALASAAGVDVALAFELDDQASAIEASLRPLELAASIEESMGELAEHLEHDCE